MFCDIGDFSAVFYLRSGDGWVTVFLFLLISFGVYIEAELYVSCLLSVYILMQ